MNNTKEAFRLIVLHWPKLRAELFDPSPYFYHDIATNREESAEEVIRLHNQRGEVENYIKELKSGFGMERCLAAKSVPTLFFFRIGVIAYNIFLTIKLLALPPWYQTLPSRRSGGGFIQVAGAIVRHAHQLLVKLVAPLNKIALFCKFRLRCYEIAYT